MNHIDNRIDALMKKCKLDLEAQVIICSFSIMLILKRDCFKFEF